MCWYVVNMRAFYGDIVVDFFKGEIQIIINFPHRMCLCVASAGACVGMYVCAISNWCAHGIFRFVFEFIAQIARGGEMATIPCTFLGNCQCPKCGASDASAKPAIRQPGAPIGSGTIPVCFIEGKLVT